MNFKTKAFSLIVAGMMVLGSITGVAAQTSTANVNVTIQAHDGALSLAKIQQYNQTKTVDVDYTSGAQIDGSVTVTVVDARYTRVGWSLDVSASDFYGTRTQATMPSIAMSVTNVAVISEIGDAAPTPSLSSFLMSTAETKVVSAASGTGSGRYNVTLDTSIVVPANTTADTYTSTITFDLSAAP